MEQFVQFILWSDLLLFVKICIAYQSGMNGMYLLEIRLEYWRKAKYGRP